MKTISFFLAVLCICASCGPDLDFDWGDTGCLGCGSYDDDYILPDPNVAGIYTVKSTIEAIRHYSSDFSVPVEDSLPYIFRDMRISISELQLNTDSSFGITTKDVPPQILKGYYKHGKNLFLDSVWVSGFDIVLFFTDTGDTIILNYDYQKDYALNQYAALFFYQGKQTAATSEYGTYNWNPGLFSTPNFDEMYVKFQYQKLTKSSDASD